MEQYEGACEHDIDIQTMTIYKYMNLTYIKYTA